MTVTHYTSTVTSGRLLGVDRAEDWRDRGACLREDPEIFFAAGSSTAAVMQTAQAKAVCRRCPVMDRCRAWVIETGEAHGVWGGLSEDDRDPRVKRNYSAEGKHLAISRGARVMTLVLGEGLTLEKAGKQLGVDARVVQHAMHLLAPGSVESPKQTEKPTIVERLLTQEETLMALRRAGRKNREIAETMHASATAVCNAMSILEQRNSARARLQMALAS